MLNLNTKVEQNHRRESEVAKRNLFINGMECFLRISWMTFWWPNLQCNRKSFTSRSQSATTAKVKISAMYTNGECKINIFVAKYWFIAVDGGWMSVVMFEVAEKGEEEVEDDSRWGNRPNGHQAFQMHWTNPKCWTRSVPIRLCESDNIPFN